jgi:hypothetical protein
MSKPKHTSPNRRPQPKAQAARPQVTADWLQLAVLMLTGLAFALLLAAGVGAQQPQMTREEALRQHRERVATLLEERRQQRARGENPNEPTGESNVPERDKPSQEEGPVLRGSAELLSEPLNVFEHVGKTFFTTITLHNTSATEVDEFTIQLGFDPQFLRPIQVSDHGVKSRLGGNPIFDTDLDAGRIVYSGNLRRAFSGLSLEMLTIEWETLVPTPRTRIELLSNAEAHCSLLRTGSDVLGDVTKPYDGTIGTDVAIRPRGDDNIRGNLLINDFASLRNVTGVTPQGGVGLSITTDASTIRVGDVVPINIRLANPARSVIDQVQVALRWDPKVFEVVDAAPTRARPPSDNWVVGGVNLQDGPFHQSYPFDFHVSNEARGEFGFARYQKGLSQARALPDGVVVRLFLRAVAPTERTTVRFQQTTERQIPTTRVTCLGIDLLGELDRPDDGTRGLAVAVRPALIAPAEAGG